MRGTMVAALVLALGACGENAGWNPNYSAGARPYGTMAGTPYTRYLAQREDALQGTAAPSRVIPIARPFKAPTPEDIAGPARQQVVQPQAQATTATTRPPVVQQGPYPGSTPVLAQYAATVGHAPGTQTWQRTGRNANRALQACRSFASADAAQISFLAHGGPEADPLGMDPDGDGFVCGWTPAPWRQAGR